MVKNNIEVFRKARKMTRPELGKRVGVGDRCIYQWERGLRTPELVHAIKLADVLEVSLDELLGRSNT